MKRATMKLHAKLYRARAIDEALALVGADLDGFTFARLRAGDYHVVEVRGAERSQARDLLAEVADTALVVTVEQDRA